jgi:hypothetical protein
MRPQCAHRARERELNATEDLLKPAQIRNEALRISLACMKRQANGVRAATREIQYPVRGPDSGNCYQDVALRSFAAMRTPRGFARSLLPDRLKRVSSAMLSTVISAPARILSSDVSAPHVYTICATCDCGMCARC